MFAQAQAGSVREEQKEGEKLAEPKRKEEFWPLLGTFCHHEYEKRTLLVIEVKWAVLSRLEALPAHGKMILEFQSNASDASGSDPFSWFS